MEIGIHDNLRKEKRAEKHGILLSSVIYIYISIVMYIYQHVVQWTRAQSQSLRTEQGT